MIAHRIEKTASDAYGRLACYIADLKNSQDPKVFERLASYVVDRPNGGERVVGMRITNCAADDFALAVKEIEATQALNTRAKGSKSYHLVISFPEGERPTPEQLRDIEEKMVAALGYEEHQRVSAIHDDTDNLHIHVAINKVHPKSRRCVEPYYDKKKLMEACIKLEVEHGLTRVNHGVNAERKHSQGEEKMHAHNARETLRQWVDQNAKEHLISSAKAAKSWEALHLAFAEVGLEIRPYGAGMVIGPPKDRVTLKASDIDRSLAIKPLVERFGAYQPPSERVREAKPRVAYTRAPAQRSPEAAALYAKYEAERAASLKARDDARTQVSTKLAAEADRLKEHYRWRRTMIRAEANLSGSARFEMLADLGVERKLKWKEYHAKAKAERDHVYLNSPLPTWQRFLQAEADAGNEHALAALREKAKTTRRLANDILTAPNLDAAKTIIDRRHRHHSRPNGDMVYTVQDGGRLTDRKSEVRMDTLSTGAALLALNLAAERFAGQALILDGTDEFKRAVVEVSAIQGFNVRFADPTLEEARLAAVKEREIAERSRPAPGSAQEYVAQRNAARENIPTIASHRMWKGEDAGKFAFGGKRSFADGSEAILLERDGEVFVKPMSAKQVGMTAHWPRGKAMFMDKHGRISLSEPKPRGRNRAAEPDRGRGVE